MPVDVGAKVKEISDEFLAPPSPNRATPENLLVLVRGLEAYTESLRREAAEVASWVPGADEQQWTWAMYQWRTRLASYRVALEGASPRDRKAVLWTVTAPLLLGYYNGEKGDKPQQVADVATPFSLQNQLEVREQFEAENWNRLIGDLKRGVTRAGIGLGAVVLIAAAVLVAWKVLD